MPFIPHTPQAFFLLINIKLMRNQYEPIIGEGKVEVIARAER
jgi:hypothetical protein